MVGPALLDYRIAKKKNDTGGTIETSGENTLGLASSAASPFIRCSFGIGEHYWWSLNLTGDRHLHSLGENYHGIPIVTPAQAVQRIAR